MTLLFFLRSSNDYDTGRPLAEDGDYESLIEEKPKKKPSKKALRASVKLAAKQAMQDENNRAKIKFKRDRDDENILMLLLHEFDDYDD